MIQLWTVLLAVVSVGVGVTLMYAVLYGRRTTGLALAGMALAVVVLASPVSYERIDAHDLLECGSVLDPVPWKPSGLPGDRATECAQAFRGRYVWAAVLAGASALSAAVMVLRRRRE